jgi:peptidoglycan hydrolase-like protein with peptidoglycan-binding domain
MRVRKATHLALTLLLAAGLGVSTGSAKAQTISQKKATPSKPGATSRRSKASKKSKRRERGQKAPTPERISEIQQALGKDGSYTATPNGKWDASTVDALTKFQQSHGLTPTGKLGAKTLQLLGLGSSTAGVAPPMPPVSSSTATIAPALSLPRQQ